MDPDWWKFLIVPMITVVGGTRFRVVRAQRRAAGRGQAIAVVRMLSGTHPVLSRWNRVFEVEPNGPDIRVKRWPHGNRWYDLTVHSATRSDRTDLRAVLTWMGTGVRWDLETDHGTIRVVLPRNRCTWFRALLQPTGAV